MEAKELRLGNLVNYEFDKDCGGLSVIDICSSDFKHLENPLIANRFLPIPLTEEWMDLDNFGLSNKYYFAGDLILSRDEGGFYLSTEDSMGVGLNYIKYVHQLQNLYFALTSKELTIK